MALFLLLCLTQVVWAEKWHYYHELSVESFQPTVTLRENSYFGYSIGYDQFKRRLIISAPRENNIGEVYECDLSRIDEKLCSRLSANIKRDASNYTHDYWFGATIKAGPKLLLACAPRYSSYIETCGVGTYGRCYARKENETNFSLQIFPVSIEPNKIIYKNKLICLNQEKKMDSLGWSLDVGVDSSIIVGGPGMFDNTGVAAFRPPEKNFIRRINKIENKIYNFGYSVAIGYFLSEYDLCYAVSSTYGIDGRGKVYFYTLESGRSDRYKILNKSVDEDVVGSMFGAVLTAAKISEFDKRDDLLVGAPTYSLNSAYNTGAVYVYVNKGGVELELRRKIVGYQYGSLFGSAIISVGDLNGDSRDDIAIGAPFEDGGAVYLYSGASICLIEKPLTFWQRIKPTITNLASFGYSLDAFEGYNENGCKQLAIGAPYNNTVMLYKCLAAVIITELYTVFPDVKNRGASRQTNYVFQVCIVVQYSNKVKRIIGELSTDVTMEHQFARFKKPSKQNVYTFKTRLQSMKKTYCENIEFVLPLDKDYSIPIEYKISTKLQNSPINLESVTDAHVVLSDNSHLFNSTLLSAAECSGAYKCISNLSLTVTSDMTDLPFTIGSRDTATFHIKVLNTGEIAYDPCLQFSISGGNVQIPPMHCSNNNERWSCTSMKPIRTDNTWEITNIIVDLQDLTNQDKIILLDLKLFDSCADTSISKLYNYTIPLKSSPHGIYATATTDVGDIVPIVEGDILFPKYFQQTYTVINKGPTNFKDLIGVVRLQKTDFITYPDEPVSIYIEPTSESVRSSKIGEECKVNTNNDLELTATCQIRSLYKDKYVRVFISLETNPDFLTSEVLKKQDSVFVNSSLTIYVDEDTPKRFSLATLIQLQEAFVDLWILIAAGLVGLLLIILLAVVLYKSGFLERKSKKKLQSLKKDVKRQTIRRSMMSHSQSETANK